MSSVSRRITTDLPIVFFELGTVVEVTHTTVGGLIKHDYPMRYRMFRCKMRAFERLFRYSKPLMENTKTAVHLRLYFLEYKASSFIALSSNKRLDV